MTKFYLLDTGDQFLDDNGTLCEKIDDESAVEVESSRLRYFNAVDVVNQQT